jgi:hypothetical protein
MNGRSSPHHSHTLLHLLTIPSQLSLSLPLYLSLPLTHSEAIQKEYWNILSLMEKQPTKKKQHTTDTTTLSQENNSTLATEMTMTSEERERASAANNSVQGSMTTKSGLKSLGDNEGDEEDEEELKRRLNRTARLYFSVKKYTQLEDRTGREWPDREEGEGGGEGDGDLTSFHELMRRKRDEKLAKFISLGKTLTHSLLTLCCYDLSLSLSVRAEDFVAIGTTEFDRRSWQPPDVFTAAPSVSMSGSEQPEKQSGETSRITSRVGPRLFPHSHCSSPQGGFHC